MLIPPLVKQLAALYSSFFRSSPQRVGLLHVLLLLRSVFGGAGILLIIPLLMVVGVDLGQPQGAVVFGRMATLFARSGIELGLIHVIVLYLIIMAGISALTYFTTQLETSLQQSFISRLRLGLYGALLKSEWRYIVSQRLSEFTRLLTDQVYATGAAINQIMNLIGQLILMMTYVLISAIVSPLLTLVALVCGMLLIALVSPLTYRIRASGRRQLGAHGEIYRLVGEQLNGLKLIKSHVLEDRYISRLASVSDQLEQQEVELTRMNSISRLVHFLGAAVVFSVLLYGAIEFMAIPLATLVLLLFIYSRLLPQIAGIQAAIQRLQHQAPAYQNLTEFEASLSEHAETMNLADHPVVQESIRLEDITYTHAGKPAPVFRNLTATIPVYATTAINGRSGIGKSTLADILSGLLWPQTGEILLDGKPMRREDRRAWRKQVAYVTQDLFLLHDSIRNNLTVISDDASEEQLWHALEMAAAADFVRALPEGLDTVVGDRGVRLSGGERQRLGIARALLTGPSMLILDESTSALDGEGIAAIGRALEGLRGQVTTIVIAHDETAVMKSDQEISVEDFVEASNPSSRSE